MLHITIVVLTFVSSIHASHMPIKVCVCWCRTHHHPTQQSFAEFGQIEPQHKRLPHCIPESKRVQSLITVQTISCCRVVVGLIDWEDPHVTCRCMGQKYLMRSVKEFFFFHLQYYSSLPPRIHMKVNMAIKQPRQALIPLGSSCGWAAWLSQGRVMNGIINSGIKARPNR